MALLKSASKKLEAALAVVLSQNFFDSDPIGTVTAAPATDLLTVSVAHGLTAGIRVGFATAGTLPAGIVANTSYYVKQVPTGSNTTLKVSALLGGSVLDITSAGVGTHSIYRGATLYEGQSSGQLDAPEHVVIAAEPEGGGLYDKGMYDVNLALVVRTLAKQQTGQIAASEARHNDRVENLCYLLRRANNAVIKAAIEAVEPTLLVTGYWPLPRQDEGSEDAFGTVLPFAFHVCNA